RPCVGGIARPFLPHGAGPTATGPPVAGLRRPYPGDHAASSRLYGRQPQVESFAAGQSPGAQSWSRESPTNAQDRSTQRSPAAAVEQQATICGAEQDAVRKPPTAAEPVTGSED